jgi:hypothetical protein
MSAVSLINNARANTSDRYSVDVVPYGNTSLSLTGANLVQFRLPKENFLIGQDIVFYFNAEADGDAASDDAFLSNIACVFNSFRVRIEGREIQHVRECGFLQCIDDNLRWQDSYRNSWGVICQGVPALASSGTAVRYGMRLLHGNVLDNVLPMYKIGQVEVEFQLNIRPAEYTEATTAVTEVDITEMQLKCPYIASEELKRHFDSQDVAVKFTDYEHFRNTNINSGDTSATIIVPTSNSSLSGILFCMRNQADVQDPNSGLEKYQSAMLTNALTRLSFVVDGTQIPRRDIDCTNQVELYGALLEYAGHRKGNMDTAPDFFNGAYDTATDGQFVVAYPFNALVGSNNTLSGLNTAKRTGQLEIHMNMTASANTQVDIWTRFDRVITFGKSGGVAVSK